jgi:HEPN domain-containing protein
MAVVRRDLDDADHALGGGRWESAGFSSIQALEKSLKALARKHTTHGDLNGRPYSEMNGLTYAQLESGGDQANVHDLGALVELLRTWHQDVFARFRPDFDWIDQAKLYERLRYPTSRWPALRERSRSVRRTRGGSARWPATYSSLSSPACSRIP